MSNPVEYAPGWPGIPPRWTSSAKVGVGSALHATSRVWFTLSHGILNEIYYPRVDQACTRDLGLIVTAEGGFFSEEKRDTVHDVSPIAQGIPAYRLVNTCECGRYRIEKVVLADPHRDVVLQQIRFECLQGVPEDYHLYVLLAPHLRNEGSGNTAWVGDYKDVPMLLAERDGRALALACSAPWLKLSAGFVGVSDGWQILKRSGELSETYLRAENGNVALIGEIDLRASESSFVLALGFGLNAAEAGHRALASLQSVFEALRSEYTRAWDQWHTSLFRLEKTPAYQSDLYRTSMAVLRTHEAKRFPGGIIASLSIPWGFDKTDDDLGGYHLVWPRDLVEVAGGLLAGGAQDDCFRVIKYLQVTQEADGHWAQNMWLDGTPYWNGIQMDETAFPILLVDLARREGMSDEELSHLWPMVRRAAGYLVRNGPVTQEDRWEEDPGYSPFTLSIEISALLLAADMAELNKESDLALYLRQTADAWNANIERWTYVTDTPLARRIGVEGYYVRITPPEVADAASPVAGFVPIKNRPPGSSEETAQNIVSPDALALVRFGLRAATDRRIIDTVKVIDALLRLETPFGPVWQRYDSDGYGEHEDGSPFDGTGIGRHWPLLTGERAHYELAAGREKEARNLLGALEAFANEGGMIPEQVWDGPDLPDRGLTFGRPSGSAMPLVWAHAEHVKLCRSLRDGRVFDMPPQPVQRYQIDKIGSPYRIWRFNDKCRTMQANQTLRLEVLSPAVVHWSADGWETIYDTQTRDTGVGVYVADLAGAQTPAGNAIRFTFYWTEAGRWEGADFEVYVSPNSV